MTQKGKKVKERRLFPGAAVTKCHNRGALKQQVYPLTVPQARGLTSLCQQSHASSQTLDTVLPGLYLVVVVAGYP